MGRETKGIHWDARRQCWEVDKEAWGTRIRRSFGAWQEANEYLTHRLEQLRQQHLFGRRPTVLFGEAVKRFVSDSVGRSGLETDLYALQVLEPYLADVPLDRINDEVLKRFIEDRRTGRIRTRSKREPRKAKNSTVNASLELVRRICNLAATKWRHEESGMTWLERAPVIVLLPKDDARPPRPITWAEQTNLLGELPAHLRRMALFALNTGVRDEVVCELRWDWELWIPELGFSVFVVPPQHVKGGLRKGEKPREGLVVCNSAVMSLLEEVRGMHDEFVFVWRRERVKHLDQEPVMRYQPVTGGMLNTAWLGACRRAGLAGLRVHDLRHTVGLRLREAGVPENTVADILWHQRAGSTMTSHYSQAQVMELRNALELIAKDTGQFNKSIRTLIAEAKSAKAVGASVQQVPQLRVVGGVGAGTNSPRKVPASGPRAIPQTPARKLVW